MFHNDVQFWRHLQSLPAGHPDPPSPNTGRDAPYTVGGASNVGGGYFFIPAAAGSAQDLIGSALLS